MLLKKYRPILTSGMIGNKTQAEQVKEWIKTPKKGKALMLYGPAGCGKTLSAELAANELGYELVEMSASEADSGHIAKACAQKSLFHNGKVLLVEGTDGLGTTRGLLDIVKKSSHPVIFTASDAYDPALRNMRAYCALVKYQRIRWNSIARYLKDICNAEGIAYAESALNQLAMMSNGDMRAALIDLEQLVSVEMEAVKTIGNRERKEDIFQALQQLFSATNLESARAALKSCTPDEVFLWLEENIPNAYRKPGEIADAYERLAVADLFRARIIKRQSWGLLKYASGSISGIALSGRSYGFVRYAAPKMFSRKNTDHDMLKKIARKLHIPSREAAECLPLLSKLMERHEGLAAALGLSDEERQLM